VGLGTGEGFCAAAFADPTRITNKTTSINVEVERQELCIILQSALNAGLDGDALECIDVTPEPEQPKLLPVMPEPVVAPAAAAESPSSNLPAFAFHRPLNDCPT
jgi:hypothetical protein